MRVSRGCGCMLLVLAIVDLVFVISGLIGLITRNVDPLWLALLAVVIFGANFVPTLMLGLSGFRRTLVGSAGSAGDVDGEAATEQEGDFGADEDGE